MLRKSEKIKRDIVVAIISILCCAGLVFIAVSVHKTKPPVNANNEIR